MFKSELKAKYPFTTSYFEQGLNNKNRSIAHSLLLYGSDLNAQYEIAIEIARILNCSDDKSENCQCLNCKWIREKQHPAVLTISKLDNKPSDDDSKTVISVKQSLMIRNSLLTTSEYHRVLIFCDAKIENEMWVPMGLNRTNFQDEVANSLLKTIEEPPNNTTFIFLTRDKGDLIETIISRSQCFFIPDCSPAARNHSTVRELLAQYPNIERIDSIDFAQKLFNLTKEHGHENILTETMNYLCELLKSNLNDKDLKYKIMKDLKVVQHTQKIINCHINPQLAFEDMCLNITDNQ